MAPLADYFAKEGVDIKKIMLVRHANAAPRDAAATAADFGLDPAIARKTPSRPRTWTRFSLLSPYFHTNAYM